MSVHYIESLSLFYFCLYNYIVTFDYLVISGCYGDVLRVNKKDSALIQFAESFLAQTGTCLFAMCVVCMLMLI